MYIQPNASIILCRNVPLNNKYEHTIYFQYTGTQTEYFKSKGFMTLDNNTYQRYGKGEMKVGVLCDNIYNCNYLMFQNTNYGNKWFYAFVTELEYINNETTLVKYELDILQTWLFDYILRECFIDRQHTRSDELYEHIINEDIETGKTYISNGVQEFNMSSMNVCIIFTPDQITGGNTYNNVYSGADVLSGVSVNNPGAINNILITYANNPAKYQQVVNIYQYPQFIGKAGQIASEGMTITPPTTIDGYIPKNKKLFTSPYNVVNVTNNCGDNIMCQYENWNKNNIGQFRIIGVAFSTPCVICCPENYRGLNVDYDNILTYTNFPKCAWANDTYREWWAQNQNKERIKLITAGLNGISGALTAGTGLATGNYGAAVYGLTNAIVSPGLHIANQLANQSDIAHSANEVGGTLQTDSLNAATNRVKFTFEKLTIKHEYAKIIDDYFTMYGYKLNIVAVPDITARPHWTYVKTIGCNATGNAPADVILKINNIFDNGITWWKNGDEVGDYSLDNTV